MTVSSYAGPEFLFPRWQIDTLATASRRWFGGTPYSEGAGGRLAATYSLIPQVQLGAAFDAQSIFYRVVTDQNGLFVSGDGEVTYTISPSSIVHFVAGVGEQGAKVPVFSDTTHWLAFDYYQDLPFGFSTNLEPAYSWTRYDAPLAAFGVTRSDRIWALKLDVLDRRIEYAGFAPRLSLVYWPATAG